jgi:hypothetical protein
MRITAGKGEPLNRIYLALSDAEALDLIGALEQLREAGPRSHGHWHVSQADFQREVTVYREDDETAANFPRFANPS